MNDIFITKGNEIVPAVSSDVHEAVVDRLLQESLTNLALMKEIRALKEQLKLADKHLEVLHNKCLDQSLIITSMASRISD